MYQCESSRAAKKLYTCFGAYLLVDSHRLHLAQLEQQLLFKHLLNVEQYNNSKLQTHSADTTTLVSLKTNTAVSSSSASSDSRPDRIDPVKSITEELQKKINSQQPLLFPPKDYDAVHAGHGNIQRAQAWKSNEVRHVFGSSLLWETSVEEKIVFVPTFNLHPTTTLSSSLLDEYILSSLSIYIAQPHFEHILQ